MNFVNKERFDLLVGKTAFSHSLGFDAGSSWQMVPRGGARGLILKGAKGFTAGIASPSGPPIVGVNAFDAGSDLEVWVDGVFEGKCELVGKSKTARVASLTLEVVRQRIVKTGFYDVRDNKGRQTDIKESTIKPLIDRVNGIFEAQTNVRMDQVGSLRLDSINDDLGDAVDLDIKSSDFAINLIDDAEYNVFFVWQLAREAGKKTTTSGITAGATTLVDATLDPVQMAVTLAHEFGHYCSTKATKQNGLMSHDPLVSDLMFHPAPHGLMVRRDRLSRIVRP